MAIFNSYFDITRGYINWTVISVVNSRSVMLTHTQLSQLSKNAKSLAFRARHLQRAGSPGHHINWGETGPMIIGQLYIHIYMYICIHDINILATPPKNRKVKFYWEQWLSTFLSFFEGYYNREQDDFLSRENDHKRGVQWGNRTWCLRGTFASNNVFFSMWG